MDFKPRADIAHQCADPQAAILSLEGTEVLHGSLQQRALLDRHCHQQWAQQIRVGVGHRAVGQLQHIVFDLKALPLGGQHRFKALATELIKGLQALQHGLDAFTHHLAVLMLALDMGKAASVGANHPTGQPVEQCLGYIQILRGLQQFLGQLRPYLRGDHLPYL